MTVTLALRRMQAGVCLKAVAGRPPLLLVARGHHSAADCALIGRQLALRTALAWPRTHSTNMVLSSAVSALRQGLLRHVRMPIQQAAAVSSTSGLAGASLSLWRGFAGGGYLDKDEVTQRVLNVTKHFEKIDPGKVSVLSALQRSGREPRRRQQICAARRRRPQRAAASPGRPPSARASPNWQQAQQQLRNATSNPAAAAAAACAAALLPLQPRRSCAKHAWPKVGVAAAQAAQAAAAALAQHELVEI